MDARWAAVFLYGVQELQTLKLGATNMLPNTSCLCGRLRGEPLSGCQSLLQRLLLPNKNLK